MDTDYTLLLEQDEAYLNYVGSIKSKYTRVAYDKALLKNRGLTARTMGDAVLPYTSSSFAWFLICIRSMGSSK